MLCQGKDLKYNGNNFSFINFKEAIIVLCNALYKENDEEFLSQVVYELSHDFTNNSLVKINFGAYKHILNHEGLDINHLYPYVRTLVKSIMQDD